MHLKLSVTSFIRISRYFLNVFYLMSKKLFTDCSVTYCLIKYNCWFLFPLITEIINDGSVLNFWLPMYKDEAFRLCSLAFTYTFPDVITSNVRNFKVVNQLVSNSANVILLYDKDNDMPLFVAFLSSLSCEVIWKNEHWIFHIIPHTTERNYFYVLRFLQENVYILEKQLRNIILFSEVERELLRTNNNSEFLFEDGFLLIKYDSN